MKAIALLQVILTSMALIGVLTLTYVHVWTQMLTWTNVTISTVFIVFLAMMLRQVIKEYKEIEY